jgi:hypothetical protein
MAASVLANQAVLTALQFGDWDAAYRLLQEAEADGADATGAPNPIISDRLFWRVLIDIEGRGQAWRQSHLAVLAEAARHDPESFQVRFWRVVGWVAAGRGGTGSDCSSAVDSFVDLALSVAEGSTCPLMMAHLGHGLDRHFQQRPETTLRSDEAIWLRAYSGINAALVGNDAAAAAAIVDLSVNASGRNCALDLAEVVQDILDTP